MTSGPGPGTTGSGVAPAQPTQSAEAQPLPALPAFFPLVRKGCEAPAGDFFQCLHADAAPGDRAAAERNLRACEGKMQLYERCFAESLAQPGARPPLVKVAFDEGGLQ